jgi:hypothetical protein
MHPLEPAQDTSRDGASAVLYVFPWKGIRIPTAARDMREAQTGEPGSDCGPREVDRKEMTSLDQQLEQMEALASRHYPDDEAERNACLVRLLKERLRTYHTMLQPLPVRQMKENK